MTSYIGNKLNSLASQMVGAIPGENGMIVPYGKVSGGIRSANDAILASLKNGLSTCLANISSRFNKSLAAQGLEGKCARAAKSALMTVPPAAPVIATDLSKIKALININSGIEVSVAAAVLMINKFFLNNLTPLIIENKTIVNDEPLTPLGFMAIAISGGVVTFIAFKILDQAKELTWAGDNFSNRITLVLSGMLASSALVTVGESILSLTIGSKAAKIAPLLSICCLPLSCGCLSHVFSNEPMTFGNGPPVYMNSPTSRLLNAAIDAGAILNSSLTYALHSSTPFQLRLALLGAYAAYNHELYLRQHNYFYSEEVKRMAMLASIAMASEALYPGYIATAVTVILAVPLVEAISLLSEAFSKLQPIYAKNHEKVEMQGVQLLVEELYPSDLAKMVMDYADEENFSRIRFPEAAQIEEIVEAQEPEIAGPQALDALD